MTAQVGVTHLLVDGKENLMDGQPYLTAEGALVMEVNALIPTSPAPAPSTMTRSMYCA